MSNTKTTPLRLDRFAVACLAALAVYVTFLSLHATSAAGGSDSAGYMMSARMVSEGRLTVPLRTIPELPAPENMWLYTPLGMVPDRSGATLMPTYPIGLPLHYAAASALFGWTGGPLVVSLLAAVAMIVLTWACARELGVERWIAAACAAMLGVSALVIFCSIQPLSDVVSAAWNAAAFYAALRGRRAGGMVWSVVCGLAVFMAVLVRPTDALVLPALCLVLWNWRKLLGAFLGGLPGAVFLAWYNHALFGSALRTGYGDIGMLFSPAWLASSLGLYATWIPQVLPIAAVAALGLPWLPWRTLKREISALIVWFLAFMGFFAFYAVTHEAWWCLRFVLPAFPAVAVVAALVLQGLKLPQLVRTIAVSAAVLATSFLQYGNFRRLGLQDIAPDQQPYRDLAVWARENLSPDAVIMTLHASCSVYFYTPFAIVRSDLIGAERFVAMRDRIIQTGRPIYAWLYIHDDEPRRQELLPGTWREIKRVDDFSLWELQRTP